MMNPPSSALLDPSSLDNSPSSERMVVIEQRQDKNWFCNPLGSFGNDDSGEGRTYPNKRRTTTTPGREISPADALLVEELNALSPKERELVFEDVHGVADVIDEDPEFVRQCLVEMESAIGRIKKKTAYNRALFLSPTLVKDRKFRLMFLRADRFVPSNAAQRIVNHFDCKLELFGEEKLAKTLTLEDLDEDDHHALRSGSFQFLPQQDRAGRTVAFVSQNLYNYRSSMSQVGVRRGKGGKKEEETTVPLGLDFSKCEGFCYAHECSRVAVVVYVVFSFPYQYIIFQIRMVWYQMMSQLEKDIDLQRKGMVDILYNVGVTTQGKVFADMAAKAYLLRDGLPFRMAALHYCFDNKSLAPAMSLVQLIIGKEARARFRAHLGACLRACVSVLEVSCQGSFRVPHPTKYTRRLC